MKHEPTIELLDSGYWHVRFSDYQFIQFPKNTVPNQSHCFGDISDAQLCMAERVTGMIQKPKFEEGVDCLDCGLEFEAENLIHSSLDAYGPLDDTFCPRCQQDNLKFHRPAEDR